MELKTSRKLQGYKRFVATNASSVPKCFHLQGCSLKCKKCLGKYEDKVTDVLDFNQNIEITCKSG